MYTPACVLDNYFDECREKLNRNEKTSLKGKKRHSEKMASREIFYKILLPKVHCHYLNKLIHHKEKTNTLLIHNLIH